MTRKIDLPPEEHVRTVMAAMLAGATAGGPRPTVLALARNLGLANATFWRHYHDIATDSASTLPRPGRPIPPRTRTSAPDRSANWSARTLPCAANVTTSPASSKPLSATCGG
jgi:hypothetical protein